MTAQGRIGRVTATVSTTSPFGRIGKVTATVTPGSTAKGRIGKVTASVTPALPVSAQVRIGGAWKPAVCWVRKNGAWVAATPWVRKSNQWVQAGVPSTPAPPTTTPVTPVGETIPVASLPGWSLIYSNDFNTVAALGQIGSAYGTDFRGYNNDFDTSKNGLYTPDKVLSAHDSVLDWYVHYDPTTVHNDHLGTPQTGWPLVAAPLPFGKATGQLYGRYAVKFKSDVLTGYKIAFLLWPVSQDWTNGAEIDLPETSLNGTDTVDGFVHTPGNPTQNALAAYSTAIGADGNWHICVIEWSAAGVKFFVDGRFIASTTVSPPQPMYWALQQETQLSGGPPSSSVSGHLMVDWIAAWSYNSTTYSALSGATMHARLNSSDKTKPVALPAGTSQFSDFTIGVFGPAANGAVGGNGVDYNGAGLLGLTRDSTVVSMTANSMTKTAPIVAGPTNGYSLVRVTKPGVVVQDLTIAGTDQGGGALDTSAPSTQWKQKCYNGLRLDGVTGGQVTRVKLLQAGPGWDFQPAGETFALNDYNGSDNVYTDVEVDGGGQGASGFATNSNARPSYTRCKSHDNPFSAGWAFWQTDSGTLVDCSTSGCHTGISFERCWGTWTLTRFTFGAAQPHHIYLGTDNYNGKGNAQVTFIDPVLPAGSKLIAFYPSVEQGGTNFQTKANLQVLVTQPDGSRRDLTSSMVTFAGTPHA